MSRNFWNDEDKYLARGIGIVYQVHAFVAMKSAHTGKELDHAEEQTYFWHTRVTSGLPTFDPKTIWGFEGKFSRNCSRPANLSHHRFDKSKTIGMIRTSPLKVKAPYR